MEKDKNRDVIVAFPDVDPSSILELPEGSDRDRYRNFNSSVGSLLHATFDRPHLWYSTSEVIRALKLFIAGSDQLSGSNTYRLTHEFKTYYYLKPTEISYLVPFSLLKSTSLKWLWLLHIGMTLWT